MPHASRVTALLAATAAAASVSVLTLAPPALADNPPVPRGGQSVVAPGFNDGPGFSAYRPEGVVGDLWYLNEAQALANPYMSFADMAFWDPDSKENTDAHAVTGYQSDKTLDAAADQTIGSNLFAEILPGTQRKYLYVRTSLNRGPAAALPNLTLTLTFRYQSATGPVRMEFTHTRRNAPLWPYEADGSRPIIDGPAKDVWTVTRNDRPVTCDGWNSLPGRVTVAGRAMRVEASVPTTDGTKTPAIRGLEHRVPVTCLGGVYNNGTQLSVSTTLTVYRHDPGVVPKSRNAASVDIGYLTTNLFTARPARPLELTWQEYSDQQAIESPFPWDRSDIRTELSWNDRNATDDTIHVKRSWTTSQVPPRTERENGFVFQDATPGGDGRRWSARIVRDSTTSSGYRIDAYNTDRSRWTCAQTRGRPVITGTTWALDVPRSCLPSSVVQLEMPLEREHASYPIILEGATPPR